MGAIDQLLLFATWTGDDDARLLAVSRAVLLKLMLSTEYFPPVPTPYWDSDSEVDDQVAVDDQVWYGEVDDPTIAPTSLTFRDRAEIWTFAGLLGIAAGPGAALSFLTVAEKFVLAFKQGNIGKIIRIFIDADEAASFTDSGDGSVKEVPIVANPDLSSHQIYITVQ